MATDNERILERIKAIAHPVRLKILCVLGDKKILSTRRENANVFYRIRDPRTIKLVETMREVL